MADLDRRVQLIDPQPDVRLPVEDPLPIKPGRRIGTFPRKREFAVGQPVGEPIQLTPDKKTRGPLGIPQKPNLYGPTGDPKDWGDSPPPNSPYMYSQVMPPPGYKYIYNQTTGARRMVRIPGQFNAASRILNQQPNPAVNNAMQLQNAGQSQALTLQSLLGLLRGIRR